MNDKNSKSFRSGRIREQIKKDVADIIRSKVKDPRIGFITITDVEVTNDYSFATIYYTVLEDNKKNSVQSALEHSKGYIRKELGSLLHIYKTPDLKFKYDITIDRGINISNLIDQVNKDN